MPIRAQGSAVRLDGGVIPAIRLPDVGLRRCRGLGDDRSRRRRPDGRGIEDGGEGVREGGSGAAAGLVAARRGRDESRLEGSLRCGADAKVRQLDLLVRGVCSRLYEMGGIDMAGRCLPVRQNEPRSAVRMVTAMRTKEILMVGIVFFL